jgi:hypothetical protein
VFRSLGSRRALALTLSGSSGHRKARACAPSADANPTNSASQVHQSGSGSSPTFPLPSASSLATMGSSRAIRCLTVERCENPGPVVFYFFVDPQGFLMAVEAGEGLGDDVERGSRAGVGAARACRLDEGLIVELEGDAGLGQVAARADVTRGLWRALRGSRRGLARSVALESVGSPD